MAIYSYMRCEADFASLQVKYGDKRLNAKKVEPIKVEVFACCPRIIHAVCQRSSKFVGENRSMDKTNITKASFKDYDQIMAVWESSVKATHDFLKQEDFEYYKHTIPNNYLPNLDVYVLRTDNKIVGFMSVSEGNLEMLFIAGDLRGKGYGRTLLEYAIQNLNASKVDVNEQNTQAVEFYKQVGFEVVGRTDKDSEGSDYPILKMEL